MTPDTLAILFVVGALTLAGIAIVVLPYWLAILIRGSTTLVRWRHD